MSQAKEARKIEKFEMDLKVTPICHRIYLIDWL